MSLARLESKIETRPIFVSILDPSLAQKTTGPTPRESVQIGGCIDAPRFTVGAKTAAQPLVERCLKAGLNSGAKALGVPVPAAAEVSAKSKAVQARAQAAEAQADERAKAEFEQKARAESERIGAEAERAKAETERKAREEAVKPGNEAKRQIGDRLKGFSR